MKHLRVVLPFIGAALIIGMNVFATGSGPAGASVNSGKAIKVGVIEDLTGVASFCGVDEAKGMQLAVKQAKAQGINISLDVKDDASTAAQAVVDLHSLADSGVSAVLGSCDSAVNEALYPIANSLKIPEIMTTGDDPTFTATPYVFGAAINSTTYVANPVPILAKQGVKTIATIYQSDVPSTVADYQTQLAAEKKDGIKSLGAYPITSTTTDFAPEVSEVAALHPDAIAILVIGSPNVTIATDLRQAGIKVPILGQVVMQTPFYIQDAKSAANGSIFATDYAPSFPFASSKAFTKAWQKSDGTTAFYASATGYDAAEYLIHGLEDAKTFTSAGVLAGLNKVKGFNGAQGILKTSKQGVLTGTGGVVEVTNGSLKYLP
jgi:branched-chain amino acid transport system substrate-binding protein